ncbi:MAG: hypothetical protein MAG795_01273 [Candidatus Woesearchaeota archaeon]|nr:hypothetical protein [Candidatus Woesearchaeota archaeon]
MKDFQFYLNERKVKKISKDTELSKSLVDDSNQRIASTKQLVIGFRKIIFENVYDSIRALLDALLAADGYKSYSHEASIAYLEKYDFEDSTLKLLDNFRYIRNSSKYYGKSISQDSAEHILEFYNEFSARIKEILNNKLC